MSTFSFLQQLIFSQPQVVDEMTVVPIVGRALTEDVASPKALRFHGTSNYGIMDFINEDQYNSGIIPSNLMIRGKSAQDHAMSGSGVILPGQISKFVNSCCIESSQGGYLTEENNTEDILPIELRKKLLVIHKRKKQSYQKLWSDIQIWLKGITSKTEAHLSYFYEDSKISELLEEFVAEFEPVENQIGAIVLLRDKIVGLEVMPTTEYWERYWQQIIRGCYGAELLRQKILGMTSSQIILPEFSNYDINEIEKTITNFINNINDDVKNLLSNINIIKSVHISTTGDFKTSIVKTKTGGGDIIKDKNNKIIYVSIIM